MILENGENVHMLNLAFAFAKSKYKAIGPKLHFKIRSFMTYHGMFMAPGFVI